MFQPPDSPASKPGLSAVGFPVGFQQVFGFWKFAAGQSGEVGADSPHSQVFGLFRGVFLLRVSLLFCPSLL